MRKIASLAFILSATCAYAASAPREQALEMLAQAQGLSEKCKFLGKADSAALNLLLSAAETKFAKQAAPAEVSIVKARGLELGKGAACTADGQQNVKDILSVVVQGVGQINPAPVAQINEEPQVATVAAPLPVLPLKQIKPAKVEKPIKHPKALVAQKQKKLPHNLPKLSPFSARAESYFVALRCNDTANLAAEYQTLVAWKGKLARNVSQAAVIQAIARAKSRARRQSC